MKNCAFFFCAQQGRDGFEGKCSLQDLVWFGCLVGCSGDVCKVIRVGLFHLKVVKSARTQKMDF